MDSIGINTKYEPRNPSDMWINCYILIGIGMFFRVISVICMQIISNPKRPNLIKIMEAPPSLVESGTSK